MFLIMLLVAGIGVDMMRFEMERTRLQNTLDRAVLAAADLDQTLDPEDVVMNYFEKSGLGDRLARDERRCEPRTWATATSRRARERPCDTQFMKMMGVDPMSAPAAGAAEESIGSVEVSLVLDISGSMNSNSRLTRLKPAARNFVDTILENSEQDKVSISIVPYATQVNAGKPLLDKYTTTQEHAYSHRVNFIADEYLQLQRWRADRADGTHRAFRRVHLLRKPDQYRSARRARIGQSWRCRDRTELFNHINGLSAGGNTSIDIGMKWGTALLDPGTRSVVSDLVAEDRIESGSTGAHRITAMARRSRCGGADVGRGERQPVQAEHRRCATATPMSGTTRTSASTRSVTTTAPTGRMTTTGTTIPMATAPTRKRDGESDGTGRCLRGTDEPGTAAAPDLSRALGADVAGAGTRATTTNSSDGAWAQWSTRPTPS
ncbi:MAG: VWA domain-containing protein [Roseovarius sp.]|nr:VWA domain-containing protein [Roseovarius sp.]